MDVFALRDEMVRECQGFAQSFTLKQTKSIYAGDRFWPAPLVQISPKFKRTDHHRSGEGRDLDPQCETMSAGERQ